MTIQSINTKETITKEAEGEKTQVEVRASHRVVSVTCDMCGFVDREARMDWRGVVSWGEGDHNPDMRDVYGVSQTSIMARLGDYIPDCEPNVIRCEVHVCPTCFADKIFPLFPKLTEAEEP